MSYDLILKNGLVIDPLNNIKGNKDIAIENGKIAAIGSGLEEGEEVYDLQGKMVMPGIIDIHTHMTRVVGGPLGYKMMAQTGVTTAIDFAGPIVDITDQLSTMGCGLNIGGLEGMIPGLEGQHLNNNNPSSQEIEDLLEMSLENGALGFKVMGGHYPLTPESTEDAIRIANDHHAMIAFHAGTTATKSDMTGMREAIDLAKEKKLLLAHINAYCRGNVDHPFDELKEALNLLINNTNVYPESHMALINGTSGYCANGVPKSGVTQMSLKRLGFSVNEKGLKEAISTGVAQVHKKIGGVNKLVTSSEGLKYWEEKGTDTGVSFPMNLPTIAVGCVMERVKPGGDFIIDIHSTDGGGIPRNNLIKRLLSLVHLEYLSLEDVVAKISLNPAKMFGLVNKGHLGVGADADITVVDTMGLKASMSFVDGNLIMTDGFVVGKEGQLITTEAGVAKARQAGLKYKVADLKESTLYKTTNPSFVNN